MNISKKDRESIKQMFGGKCAYCGCGLGNRWHADHIEPVLRESTYIRGKGFVQTGKLLVPERDNIKNIMPACAPCNIDKHSFSLEEWRTRLSRLRGVCQRNHSAYRHAVRWGLVVETDVKIVFYFEKASAAQLCGS